MTQGTTAPFELVDYDAERASFSWHGARSLLDGLPDGRGLNIAHEAVDRHAAGPSASQVALRFLCRDGAVSEQTYAELRDETSRFANVLAGLGVTRGERVFALLKRTPALYVTALGTLKHRAVFCPLFAAFGPDPIAQRLDRGDGAVLVTTPVLYRRKIAMLRGRLPKLRQVLLTGEGSDEMVRAGTGACVESLDALMRSAPTTYEIGPTDPEDMALLHFTSGTTGAPKGAVHVHGAVIAHHVTARYALDLRRGDTFWCTADPGWVTGTSYGIIAPLTHAVTTVVDEGEFDAQRWYQTLQDQRVSGVVHGADRDPDADARGRRPSLRVRPSIIALHCECR